jgi:hypothetical protein
LFSLTLVYSNVISELFNVSMRLPSAIMQI